MAINSKFSVGSRVRISETATRYQRRTGTILEQHGPASEKSDTQWLVRCDWPLGGMGSYEIVREEDLEILHNIPHSGGTLK